MSTRDDWIVHMHEKEIWEGRLGWILNFLYYTPKTILGLDG